MSLIMNETQRLFNMIGRNFSCGLRDDVIGVIDDFVLQLQVMDERKAILKDLATECNNLLMNFHCCELDFYENETNICLNNYVDFITDLEIEKTDCGEIKINGTVEELDEANELWNEYVFSIYDFNDYFENIKHIFPDNCKYFSPKNVRNKTEVDEDAYGRCEYNKFMENCRRSKRLRG